MSQERITFAIFVYALNKNELKDYCERYEINVSNIDRARNLNFYRSNLIKAMEKEHNKDSMTIKTFIKKVAPTLSHETIIKIYPQYHQYFENKKLEKEQKKFNEENQQQEDNYEQSYINYYESPKKPKASQVNKIEYLTAEEIQRQKDEQIMKALIEQRKKEDFVRLNKDKIHSSPFADKIDAIKATVEKQLRKLRELEEQDKEWKQEQEKQQEQEKEYEEAYENYYSELPSYNQIFKGTSKITFSPVKIAKKFAPTTEPEKRIHKAITNP